MDAEYFGKNVLAAINLLQAMKAQPLECLAHITDGIHASLPFVEDGEIKVLSAKHPKENFIDYSQFEKISTAFHLANSRTALRENDVILSTVGTIGNAAVVTHDILPANSDRHIGIIRIKQDELSPFFVSTVLVSRYGRIQSVRETTGNVQPNLFISKIGRLLIPRFSPLFEAMISDTIQLAYGKRKLAACHLEEAEQTLLQAIGLNIWQPPEPLSYIRNSSEAFAAGRFDAEYFHPAKTEALEKLNAISDCVVGDLFDSIRELWQPDNGHGSDFVRNYDLTDALNPFLDGSKDLADRTTIASTKKIIRNGELVISRLRSYLKEIALVQSDDDIQMVASTEFIVLRPKKFGILPVEALMVFLRSTLPQLIFKWSQDGSNHPRFDEKELLRMPVPRVLIQQADDYVTAVRLVISKRQRASQLLTAAKRAVEIAIEDSEAAALASLEGLTSEILAADHMTQPL